MKMLDFLNVSHPIKTIISRYNKVNIIDTITSIHILKLLVRLFRLERCYFYSPAVWHNVVLLAVTVPWEEVGAGHLLLR